MNSVAFALLALGTAGLCDASPLVPTRIPSLRSRQTASFCPGEFHRDLYCCEVPHQAVGCSPGATIHLATKSLCQLTNTEIAPTTATETAMTLNAFCALTGRTGACCSIEEDGSGCDSLADSGV
jgi:hypothetical protein